MRIFNMTAKKGAIYDNFNDRKSGVAFENGIKEYKNCILCIPPNTKHFTPEPRIFDYCFPAMRTGL